MLSKRCVYAAGLGASLFACVPLGAQVTGSLSGFAGYYRPFGHFEPASVYLTSLPETPEQLRATAWGGAGQVSFGRRFGLVTQVAATDSRVPEVDAPGGRRGPTDARVVVVTVQGQYDVSPRPRAYHIWLNAGSGFVRHGGQAYAPLGSPTDVSGALGATVAVKLVSHLQLIANATAVVYRIDIPMPPHLRLNPGSLERGTQRDGLVHVGLGFGDLRLCHLVNHCG